MTGALLDDIQVRRAGDFYELHLPERWDFRSTSGGVLTSIALSAMRAELNDPQLILRSSTTTFIKQVFAGPLRVFVKVLRKGRAAAQIRAVINPEDAVADEARGLSVTAIFAREQPGPSALGPEFPEVPHYEGLPSEPWEARRVRFFQNFEDRVALGSLSWHRDWVPGPARYARWLRYRCACLDKDGRIDALSLPPIADLMPPALVNQLGPKMPRFFAPSLDLTVHYLQRSAVYSRSPWLLLYGRASWAGSGVCSANVEIWDEERALLSYATQTMLIRQV